MFEMTNSYMFFIFGAALRFHVRDERHRGNKDASTLKETDSFW